MEGFLRYRVGSLYLEGLMHGGAYFRNFMVTMIDCEARGQRGLQP